jgi:glycosyltransferase involved in cell wall biosynthesis
LLKVVRCSNSEPGPPDYAIPAGKNLKYKVNKLLPGRVYNQAYKYGVAPPVDLLVGARPRDVFLFPNFVRFPLWFNRHSLLVIHDLSFIYFSQHTHPKDLPYKLKYVPKSIKKAERILTISESSKQQIIDHYKIPASKVSIVHPGVDTTFFYKQSAAEISKIKRQYNLPNKYILYAGTIEPRKNIIGLLKAYEQLDGKVKKTYGLVLAGGKGWQDEGILDKVEQLKKSGHHIIQTGYVDDQDYPAIYSGAELFVFPSFYEGFGIPPLEAMACQVPVISANNSSLPEAVGDAGILIDANQPQQITDAINKVLGDSKLRATLIQKGIDQTKKFSWDKSAEELKAAIDAVV